MPLSKAPRITIDVSGFWIFKRGRVWLTKRQYVAFQFRRFESIETTQLTKPVPVFAEGQRTLWWYKDTFYWDSDNLNSESVALLIWEREGRLETKLSKLREMKESSP